MTLVVNSLEMALESIANGGEELIFGDVILGLESVCRLMASCSAESSKVKKLGLGSSGLDTNAAELIASSLRSNSVLTWLNLGGNNEVGPRGAQAFGEVLRVNLELKLLFLHSCSVGDEGAGHLAVALRRNRTLQGLYLGNNIITHVGASDIAAVLPFNQTLKCLQLDDNPLGNDGVEALAKAVPLSGLNKLWLHDTQFCAPGCAALVEMLKSGSRLLELGTDFDHWRALEEGFRCNGWLLGGAPEQLMKRNKAMHSQARKSMYTLLLIRKLRRTALSLFPKEVVREIAQFVYSSRGEVEVWNLREAPSKVRETHEVRRKGCLCF
jgi:hypothetical protein